MSQHVARWGLSALLIVFALSAAPASAAVTSVSAGQEHSCAVKTGGAVVCWGDDSSGQTNAGTVGEVSQMQSGGFFSCAVKTNATPVCWGDDSEHQSTVPSDIGDVTQITTGLAHACAVQSDGAPRCWGWNGDQQTDIPPALTESKQISAGGFHTCAIQSDDLPVCWGFAGDGATDVPPAIGAVTAISAGLIHTCAIAAGGVPVCWGDDTGGQTDVPAGITVKRISAGGFNTCAIKTDDTPVCWGDDAAHQSAVPSGVGEVTQISAGYMHTCAVKKTGGTVVCWGDDSSDQLGRAPAITSPALSAQIDGAPFTHAVTVTDGTFPSTLAALGLPPGVQLTGGAIGGTPTQTGTFTGTITASDGVFADTQDFSIAVDVTPPATTDDVPSAPVNHPVTVTLGVTDAGWGDVAQTLYSTDGSLPALAYDPAHKPVLANGQVIKYFSVDTAGNTEPVRTSATVKVDTTAPAVTITAPANGATYTQGRRALAAFACSDACTGTVGPGAAFDTTRLGSHTFTVTARDAAGNVTTRTVSYAVVAPPAAPDTVGPALTILARNKTLAQRKGVVRFALGRAIEPVSGRIALKAKRLKVGSATFTAATGRAATVKIKLSRKARKALAKAKKLKATATITVRDSAGNPTVKTFKLTIKLR